MIQRIYKSLFAVVTTVGLAAKLFSIDANAAVQAWDPNGTTSVGGNAVWDLTTKNWTPAGTQAQVASGSLALWNSVGTNAAVFCAGPSGSTSQGNFIITVNDAIPNGGIFNGSLTPGPCTVTFQGPGSLNITPASGAVATFSTFNSSVGNTIINIPITGTSKVNVQSTGQLFLNGTNTYTGGTYIGYSTGSCQGILNFAGVSSFGTGNIVVSNTSSGLAAMVVEGTSAVTITNKITWSILGGGVNFVGNPAGVTFSGTCAIAAAATNANMYAGGTGNLVILSGVISGGKAGGFLNKGNASTMRLSGANTHILTTTVSNGVLQAGNATCIPLNSATPDTGKGDLWAYGAGIFDLNGFSPTISGLSGTGTIDNKSATASTLNVGTNNTASTWTGVIQNTAGALSLTKIGTGTLTLAGTSLYSGNTTLTGGGTLVAQNGNTSVPANSPVNIQGGSTLDFAGNSMTLTNLMGGRGNIVNNSGVLTMVGNSTTNSSTVTYSGYGGNIDNGTLSKNGNATMSLRGACNLTSVQLNSGILSVGAGADRISSIGGATIAIADGATFQLDAVTQTVAQITGTGYINLGGGTLYLSSSVSGTYSGVIQDSDIGPVAGTQGHGLRGYYYDNQDFTVLKTVRDDTNVNFSDLTLASQLPATIYPNTNQTSIRWVGQILAPVSGTYTFSVTADDGVRLWIGGNSVIDGWTTGNSTRTGTVTLAANTRYDITLEYFNQTGGARALLAWTPPGDATSTIIPTDYLFLPGAGSLVKDGAAPVQINGTNNTYTGSTIVKAGSLEVSADHGLGSGNVYVQDGATLTLDSGTANDYIANAADLLVTGSGLVNLNFTGTDLVRNLSLDGGATYLPAGTYGSSTSTAQHKDGHFAGSGLIQVAGLPSTTTLLSSGDTSSYGSTVTLTAVAHGTGTTPTGTITFFDGANAMGTVAVDGTGTAVLSVSNLLVTTSPHSVTAVYNGDATYGTSTSSAVTQTVTPITLSGVTGSTKVYDQTTTAPLNLTNLIGVLPIDTNLVQIAPGFVANYSDKNVGNGKAVTASAISLTGGAAGNYTIAATANTVGNITPKLLTVTNSTASNKVYDGTTAATVNASAAGITGISTNVIFAGDDATPNFAGATGVFASANVSNSITVTVTVPLTGADGGNYLATGVPKANITKATTALALNSSANPANSGDNVSFTATTSDLTGAGTPTGNVTFLTNSVVFATTPLAGVSANSGGTTALPVGTNTITAQYAGDINFVGSTNTLQQVINSSSGQQPTMTIGQSGGSITITWTGAFNLQSVNALQSTGTAWQTIPGAVSGYTTPTTNAATFYRLSN